MKKKKRTATVFLGLIGVLAATSALLLVLQPAPLRPDSTSMMAVSETSDDTATLPQPAAPLVQGHWQYIYIHQLHASRLPDTRATAGANAVGDHFIITSGPEARIVPTSRWDAQVPPLPPQGMKGIHPRCLSIVLVGDLDRTLPTTAQINQTTKLVRSLQNQLQIPAANVILLDQKTPAGNVGKFFPTAAFRETLAP